MIHEFRLFLSITDNRGNGAALNKLMSTRLPSSAVLVELASFMKARRIRAIVEWAPREYNREADLLANGIHNLFDPERRMPVSAQSLVCNVLPEALMAGREAEQAFKRTKENHGLPIHNQKQRKRRGESRLKVTDPWREHRLHSCNNVPSILLRILFGRYVCTLACVRFPHLHYALCIVGYSLLWVSYCLQGYLFGGHRAYTFSVGLSSWLGSSESHRQLQLIRAELSLLAESHSKLSTHQFSC